MNSPKKTRIRFPLAKKIEMLDLAKQGKPRPEICEAYGISPSTLQNFIREETKLRSDFGKNGNSKRFMIRDSPHHNLEQSLVKWIHVVREKKVALTGPMVQEKAIEFATLSGEKDFTASNGWLYRFQKRENLTFQNVVGEGGDVNLSVVENWTETVLPSLLKDYSPEDVYNADETGLFFHAQPKKTLHFRGERCDGGKQSKERISVLVCANMTGTDKPKLLVIGKAAKPRCFKNVKSLPVVYRNNKRAWMTSDIFVEWLRSLDKQFRLQKRKCLLLIDNCPR